LNFAAFFKISRLHPVNPKILDILIQTICYNLPNDLEVTSMLQINKNYLLDQNQKPIAVQIPITEFEQIEEILENYGLAKLMEEVEDDEILSKNESYQIFTNHLNHPI
jgi:hypothetical protein